MKAGMITKAPKRRKRKPSLRQRRAIANLVENGGNKRRAIIDAGYKPSVADDPSKVFDAVAVRDEFAALLDKFLPDDLLLKVHNEGLNATKKVPGMKINIGDEDKPVLQEVVTDEPDYFARHKYLDLGYKLKGRLKETPGGIAAVQVNISDDRQKFA